MEEFDDPSPNRFTELANPVTLATELAKPDTLAKLAEKPDDDDDPEEDEVAVCGEFCEGGGGGEDLTGLAFCNAACCCSNSSILALIPLNMVCVAWISSKL